MVKDKVKLFEKKLYEIDSIADNLCQHHGLDNLDELVAKIKGHYFNNNLDNTKADVVKLMKKHTHLSKFNVSENITSFIADFVDVNNIECELSGYYYAQDHNHHETWAKFEHNFNQLLANNFEQIDDDFDDFLKHDYILTCQFVYSDNGMQIELHNYEFQLDLNDLQAIIHNSNIKHSEPQDLSELNDNTLLIYTMEYK